MDTNKLSVKIARIEEKVLGHENRIENLEDNHEILTRLSVLMECTTETNSKIQQTLEKQQVQINQQHQTLTKMNENLDGLNRRLDNVSERVTQIEKERHAALKDDEKRRKDLVWKVIGSVVVAIVLLYLGLK